MLDIVVLTAFLVIQADRDPLVFYVSAIDLALIFVGEGWFLRWRAKTS